MSKQIINKPTFDCPGCGNPLFFTRKEIIVCKYCNGKVKPQRNKPFAPAELIYKK